jgi:hypothetical protein
MKRFYATTYDLPVCITVAVVVVMLMFVGCDSSYESDYSSDYSSGSSGTLSEGNTSESYRRDVTDEMIKQGSDPTDAEAFTSELFKAQREWEKNNN